MKYLALSFLPIVILFLVIILVAVIIMKTVAKRAAFFNAIIVKWLLTGYVVILFLAVGFSYMIPTGTENDELMNEISVADAEKIFENFHRAKVEGTIENTEGVHVADEWSFPLYSSVLNINVLQDDQSSMWVVINRKLTNDGKLDIIRYTTPHIIQGMDVTHYSRSPEIQIQDETLTIERPQRKEVKLAKFHKEFTITQFTGETMFSNGHYGTMGVNVLYLMVPPDVQIIPGDFINLEDVSS